MKATLARLIRSLKTLSDEAEDDEIMDSLNSAIQHLEDARERLATLEEDEPESDWEDEPDEV